MHCEYNAKNTIRLHDIGNVVPVELSLNLSPNNCPFDKVEEQDSFKTIVLNQPEMNI
jgi:hypothetical protein